MATFKSKILHGFKWTTIYTLTNAIFNALVIIVMGIYFNSDELGAKAIVALIITLAVMVTQFGISQAIIQNEKVSHEELNSLFVFNIIIGAICAVIVYFLSGLIAAFYEESSLSYLIKVSSIIFVLESVVLVQKAVLEKDLQFKLTAIINIFRITLNSLITVVFTILHFGVISFIYGHIIGVLSSIILLDVIFRKRKYWRPRLQFQFNHIKKYMSFGIYVTGKNFVNYGTKNFDEIIIGKILGFEALGIYHLAKQVVDKFIELATYSISKVNFPIFCKVLKENEGNSVFKAIYLKMTKYVSNIGFPIIIITIVTLPIVIELFHMDAKWTNSVSIMIIFLIKGLFDLLSGGFSSSALYAYNLPRKVFLIDVYLIPIRLTSLYIGTLISLQAVALSYLIFVIIKVIILQQAVNKVAVITWGEYLSKVIYPALLSAISLLLLKWLDLDFGIYINLILSLLVFLLIYTLPIIYFYSRKNGEIV